MMCLGSCLTDLAGDVPLKYRWYNTGLQELFTIKKKDN